MVNSVTLIGNLGQDPEVRTTQSGQQVATLRIATTDKYKDKDGNFTERTEWHTVVVWGKQAESCGRYLSKGRHVYVDGRLQSRKWKDRDGNERVSVEVVANDVRFLGGGGKSDERPVQAQQQASVPHDEDIPF